MDLVSQRAKGPGPTLTPEGPDRASASLSSTRFLVSTYSVVRTDSRADLPGPCKEMHSGGFNCWKQGDIARSFVEPKMLVIDPEAAVGSRFYGLGCFNCHGLAHYFFFLPCSSLGERQRSFRACMRSPASRFFDHVLSHLLDTRSRPFHNFSTLAFSVPLSKILSLGLFNVPQRLITRLITSRLDFS